MNTIQSDFTTLIDELAFNIRQVVEIQQGFVPLHIPVIGGNANKYVAECIDTGWVSSVGKFVDRFEKDLAEFTGANRAVAVVNGTSALHVALLLSDVRPNDEILVPSLTFVATTNAIMYCNAVPHFVDINRETLGIDPDAIREYLHEITEIRNGECINRETGRRIQCLVGMHTFGHCFDIQDTLELCQEFGISLVEDAAESIGSYFQNRHTGTFGRLGIFSFNGNKTITTGGGGAIVTNDDGLADLAKHLTTTGKVNHPFRYFHDQVAFNYRMPNLNAALGCSQLEDLPSLLASKRQIANRYIETFSDWEYGSIFVEPPDSKSNYWLNALLLSDSSGDLLDQIIEGLQEKQIMTRPVWDPIHTLPAYTQMPRMNLDVTTELSKRILNLPSTPSVV